MRNKGLISTVKAQKCDHCSHHEIGTIDKDGEFTQLKPGTQIIIVEREEDNGSNTG
jgi:hypothetical protein